MSSIKRIASGASASMAGMVLNIVAQIATVPIILSHWDQTTYGVWLAVQGVMVVMVLVDVSHQDFVGYECLRTPVEDRVWRSRVISSALPFALLTGSALVAVFAILKLTGLIALFFGDAGPELGQAAATAILIYATSWMFAQCFTGLIGRVLSSVGEAPRVAWIGIAQSLVIWSAQVTAVISGYGIVGVAVFQAIATVSFSVLIYLQYFRLLRRNRIYLIAPEWRLGGRNLLRSFALTFSALIETLQQGGFRVVLVPLIGPLAVAQFATLRTVANTAQQGVNTFVGPTVPELMRVASARHAGGTVAILSLLWFMAVMLIAPGIVLLQLVAPFIYQEWTRGKIAWDGTTFALLSAAIVINGFGQPGRAILAGNNLLRSQLAVSVSAGVILLAGAWVLVPWLGLVGAALALAGGEAVRTGLLTYLSFRWLQGATLDPPRRIMAVNAAVVLACAVTVTAMAFWPHLYLPIVGSFVIVWLIALRTFWGLLPSEVRDRLKPLLRRLGPNRSVPVRDAGARETEPWQ